VLGLIYVGVTTPTEAAAVGSACAIIIAATYKNLNIATLKQALLKTVRTTCMVLFVYIGASILSSTVAYLFIPQRISEAIIALNISKYVILTILCFIYILMGCFLEGVSMMVLTLPVVFPFILTLGFDPIWFGIVMVILIEVAQITPPVGLNLYVINNLTGDDITVIAKSALPFFMILLLGIVLITFYPNIALWLPSMMIR